MRDAANEPVGGVCILRDARDIVPFLCGHYLGLGFNRIHFVDDGSSDGTEEFLLRMSRREPRVTVERVEASMFMQAGEVSRAVNALIDDGIRVVFPFDSDEFWNVDLNAIRKVVANASSGLIVGKWAPFVQDRRRPVFRRLAPMAVRYRAPGLLGSIGHADGAGIPPIWRSKEKVAFKADEPVEVGRGQHRLDVGPTDILVQDVEVFHLALRSANEIEKRSETAPRLVFRKKHGTLREFLEDALSSKSRNEIWEENSVDADGCLHANGEAIALIPDTRMRNLLVKAWLYMALRHPLLLLR
jgi:hypothetical protein